MLPMFKHLLLPLTVHIGELWFWFVIFVHSGIENGMCSIVQCTIRPPKRSFRFSTSARKRSYLSLSKFLPSDWSWRIVMKGGNQGVKIIHIALVNSDPIALK